MSSVHINISLSHSVNEIYPKIEESFPAKVILLSTTFAVNTVLDPLPGGDNIYNCPDGYKASTTSTSLTDNPVETKSKYLLNKNFVCLPCPEGTYNLTHGVLNQTVDDTLIAVDIKCGECPVGATCKGNKNIKPIDNYWGKLQSDHNSVVFYPCPDNVCCVEPKCREYGEYGACYGNYSGNLCSTCLPGYRLCIVNYDCIETSKPCDIALFWAIYIAGALGYALFGLMISHSREVIYGLKIFWRKITCRSISEPEPNSKSDNKMNLFVFFLQAAYVVQLEPQGTSSTVAHYLEDVSKIFNCNVFKLFFLPSGILCPWKNLYYIEILILKIIFAVTVNILAIMIHFLLNLYLHKNYDDKHAFCINCILKIKDFTFFILLDATLQMIPCIDIDGGLYLYHDATVRCKIGYQVIVIIFIVSFVLLYPLVNIFLFKDMKDRKISYNMFILCIYFPILYPLHCLVVRMKSRERESIEYHRFPLRWKEVHRIYEPYRLINWKLLANGSKLFKMTLLVRLTLLKIGLVAIDVFSYGVSTTKYTLIQVALVSSFTHHVLTLGYLSIMDNVLDAVVHVLLIALSVISLSRAGLYEDSRSPSVVLEMQTSLFVFTVTFFKFMLFTLFQIAKCFDIELDQTFNKIRIKFGFTPVRKISRQINLRKKSNFMLEENVESIS